MGEIVSIVSRFVDAAVWSLAATLGVALVVGTVAYCGERLRRFVRLGLVLCGLAVCVTLFSVKPPSGNTNGVNRVRAPLRVPRPPVPVEPAADVVRISEIAVTTNGIDLVLHRPSTNDLAAVEVVLVGSTNLVAATWEPYTNLVFGAGETNVAVWVDRAQLDAHAVSNSCFFAFINAGDTDGDGLADWHERFNLKTDPDAADSDGDGLRDDWEIAHGRDPRSSVDCVLSTRADGVPDVYVIRHGGDPDSPSDGALVPVFTASENSGTDLAAALAASVPYSIVEVEPGVHEGKGWTGIRFPPHPVYVCPASGGPNRTVLRHRDRVGNAGGGLAAFEIPSGTPPGTCVEGLRIELLGESDPQIAFWVGSNLPGISGTGCGAFFRDVVVRMPRPGVQNWAWYLGSPADDAVALSGCAVDARGATAACGVWAVSSGPLLVENCSFLNFPFGGDTRFEYGVGVGLNATARQTPTNAAVRVTGTLFDGSFTNGWAVARVGEATNGGVYSVSFDHSLLPSHFPSAAARRPDVAEGLLFGEAGVAVTGQLTNGQSLAVGACPRPQFSRIDLNGLGRAAPTDIGAFAYAPVPAGALDSDGDGISDADEFAQGTDPFSDDTDGDGVPDPVEIAEGTDPVNVLSFLRHISVTVENREVIANTTNYVARGTTPDWTADDLNGVWTATGRGGTGAFDGVSASQRVFVKAYRDLGKDGICDPLREPVVSRSVGMWEVAPSFRFAFGDVDGDGVDDVQEHADGTNPNDALNFLFTATLTVMNVDETVSITNHLAWWSVEGEIIGEATFTGARFEQAVSTVVTNGRLHVVCWRDLDRDGVYTAGVDARREWTFSRPGNTSLTIGDADNDSIPDGVELADGADWNASTNYCFNLSVAYTDIFQTTNALTFAALWGTNTVWGPTPVPDRTWSFDFGHRVAAHGERASVQVWDDIDGNGRWDENEAGDRYEFRPSAHTTAVTNALPYGSFDRDRDNLPDWWEVENGLSMNGVPSDEYADPDEDGLINLHEFWAGTNPLVPDGSNTLLSVIARSVDQRIAGRNPTNSLDVYENYVSNGWQTNFVRNSECWLHDVDVSCCSMWTDPSLSAFGPTTTPVTVISPRHVVYAQHFDYHDRGTDRPTMPIGKKCYFTGKSGTIYERTLTAKRNVGGDIAIGLLDCALPISDVVSAVILPVSYTNYIANAKTLPVVFVDQLERAYIGSCNGLPTGGGDFGIFWERIGVRYEFRKVSGAIGGDSSSPKFFLVGDLPVLLGVTHKAGGAAGAFISRYKTDMERVMRQLLPDPAYVLQELDLSFYETLQGKLK